jgi:hypothetical protein
MATKRRWSQRVTQTSDALTLEEGVFTRDPAAIARSLKRSAERSKRRKASPFRSAMSMLTFYENRAGRTLSATRRRKIDAAKTELRKLYGKEDRTQKSEQPRKRTTKKKQTRAQPRQRTNKKAASKRKRASRTRKQR